MILWIMNKNKHCSKKEMNARIAILWMLLVIYPYINCWACWAKALFSHPWQVASVSRYSNDNLSNTFIYFFLELFSSCDFPSLCPRCNHGIHLQHWCTWEIFSNSILLNIIVYRNWSLHSSGFFSPQTKLYIKCWKFKCSL